MGGIIPSENDAINNLNSSFLNELVVLSVEFDMTRRGPIKTRNEVLNLKKKNHNHYTCGNDFEGFEVFFNAL